MLSDIETVLKNPEKLQQVSAMLFMDVDTDRSGFIDQSELKTLMDNVAKETGIKAPSDRHIRSVLRSVDLNRDGKISLFEFTALVKQILAEMKKK